MRHKDWVIGHGLQNGEMILVHVAEPWFCCSYSDSEEKAGEFFGLTVNTSNRFFYNFRWADGLPNEDTIRQLCGEADSILSK